MGGMVGGFLAGMLLVLVFMVPADRIAARTFGRHRWMEGGVRKGFASWLRTLGVLGLVRQAPSEGKPCPRPCVVVCNHPGLFDVLFLIKDIPNLCVLVKPSLPRFLPLKHILKSLGYILAPDHDQVNPMDAAEAAMAELRAGNKLQLFPEGTRSPRGQLRRFRPGAFKIARMTGVPVQPVLIRNDPPFLPKEERWYYPQRNTRTFKLQFWEPLPPPAKGEERAMARALEMRYRRALGMETGREGHP
jgi:1-acyl-sn-glycerol-3-phosphate acyltransferase